MGIYLYCIVLRAFAFGHRSIIIVIIINFWPFCTAGTPVYGVSRPNSLFVPILLKQCRIVSHLPGGHLPPPKFGHLPPPKKTFARRTTATPNFFSLFFWRIFLGFFDLQLMEDIKDGKEEVLDEVVMEHIK